MSELRKDLVRNSWVIIATDQALGVEEFPMRKHRVSVPGHNHICPFCEGNEGMTTLELAAYRREGSPANGPGWTVRAIPNKYSPFRLQGDFVFEQYGIYHSNKGLGQHEVIVETPRHGVEFHQLSLAQLEAVLTMFQERYQFLSADRRIKYIQIYKNRGLFAGASIEHSHSQILALPMIPPHIEEIGAYYQNHGRCVLCDILEQEIAFQNRVIYSSASFVLLCPYASRYPYEVWLIPRLHKEHFSYINKSNIKAMAGIVKGILNAMLMLLDDPSYNLILNSAPLHTTKDGFHWYLEIYPRLMIPNGMEITCGYCINPVSPQLAAESLRSNFQHFEEFFAGSI